MIAPAPSPDPGLVERYRAALAVLDGLDVFERFDLLADVICPSERVLAAQAEAHDRTED